VEFSITAYAGAAYAGALLGAVIFILRSALVRFIIFPLWALFNFLARQGISLGYHLLNT